MFKKDSLKIYELLGANFFQKIVLKVEKIKFIIIDKFFHNSQQSYDKYCDIKCQRDCKKASSNEEKQLIINNYKLEKLKYRKELITKKNRNYHLDLNQPEETLSYLKLNKKIHIKGLKKDIGFIIGSLLLLVVPNEIIFSIAISSIIFNSLFLLIDFQCVNLQNYNIKRLEINRQRLEKLANKRQERNIKKYGDAAKVIANELTKTDTIPTPNEIVSNANTLEELKQMKSLLLTYIKNDNNIKEGGQKIK